MPEGYKSGHAFGDAATRAFEAELGRDLTLTEQVAIAANTKAVVRKHFKAEFGKDLPA